MTAPVSRLAGVRLAALRDLGQAELREAFSQPENAIATLHADLRLLWDDHRSDDWDERVVGTIHLTSGAYLQWIGYADQLVVECSSNAYLPKEARLSARQQSLVIRTGFSPPDHDEPNFWLHVTERRDCGAASFSVVAVLTAVFGVYAG